MMTHLLRRMAFLVLTLLIWLLPGHTAVAQPTAVFSVSEVRVQEGTTSLSLELFLKLAGASPGVVPQTADLLLDDGGRYPAQLSQPPYYVALVIDASGSMRSVLPRLQEALQALVAQAPPQIHFAVIRFDEQIHLVQPFTANHAQVATAIAAIEPGESGTCLYDATYTAVQSLEQIAGESPHRALLLFSDGRDERRQGFSEACSSYSLEQLLAYAGDRPTPVPIYAVGLGTTPGRVATNILRQMAQRTGGQLADETLLATQVQTLLAEISQRWVARLSLQPPQGVRRGALLVTLSDQSLLAPVPVTFAASRSFVVTQPPPPPLALTIDNLVYDAATNLYRFDVSLSTTQGVGSLRIDVLDKNNVQVTRLLHNAPVLPVQTLALNGALLQAKEAYSLEVTPLSLSGRALWAENGRNLTARYPFTHNPPLPLRLSIDGVQQLDAPARLDLRSWRLVDDEAAVRIAFHVENGVQVARYEALLISLQTNQPLAAPFILPGAQTANGPLTAEIPIELASGAYNLLLHALAEDGQRLATTRYAFSAQTPDAPLWRAIKALQANPILWLLFLPPLLLLLLLAWWLGLMVGRSRRPLAPPPLAQEAAKGAPPVRLQILETADPAFANGAGVQRVTRFPYTIGREGCDLTIAGDRHISRRHAQISYEGGIFYLLDFGSSNGTFVNEARVEANKPTPLSSDIGAQIRLGKTTLIAFAEEKGD